MNENLLGNDYVNKLIFEYFSKLLNFFDTQINMKKLSILVCGSLSRNEETIIKKNDSYELLSDLDYIIIGNFKNKNRKHLNKKIKEFTKPYQNMFHNPLFHIDFSFIKKSGIRKLPNKLFIFETKRYAKIISGENFLADFPDVRINNLDLEDLNDILIHRLFSVFYYGSKLDQKDDYYNIYLKYLFARNSLDFLTVILPYKGWLIAGYKNRLDFLRKKFAKNELTADSIISDDFIIFMEKAIFLKNDPLKHAHEIDLNFLIRNFLYYCVRIWEDLCIKHKLFYYNQLGVLKRALLKRKIPVSKYTHLNRLINEINSIYIEKKTYNLAKSREIHDRIVSDNYLLYGYPIENTE